MENNERIGTVAEMILDRMEDILRRGQPDTKDLKAMTSALKELSEVRGNEGGSSRNRLTVRFSGETEKMSE